MHLNMENMHSHILPGSKGDKIVTSMHLLIPGGPLSK